MENNLKQNSLMDQFVKTENIFEYPHSTGNCQIKK